MKDSNVVPSASSLAMCGVIRILTCASIVGFATAADHCNTVGHLKLNQYTPTVSKRFDSRRGGLIRHSMKRSQREKEEEERREDPSHLYTGSFCGKSTCIEQCGSSNVSIDGGSGLPAYLSKIPRCGAAAGAGAGADTHEPRCYKMQTPQTVHLVHKGGAIAKASENPKKNVILFRNEIPRFIYMSTMMFLFIYVYTTARDTKDTLVVSNCGAESIPFLKMYGVMPSAFLFIIIYSKLSQWLGKKALFHATLIPFFGFYTAFAFFLYPNRDKLHLVQTAADSGVGSAALNLVRYWSFSLYFVVSELWASAGVPLLFWQVANDITTMSQAKRFYPLFAVTGNLAPIFSGKVMQYIVSRQPSGGEGFGETLKSLAIVKAICGIAIIALYNLIYMGSDNTNSDRSLDDKTAERKVPKPILKKSARPSLSESISELSKSHELKNLACMVLGYNVCVELTEVLWKGILRKTHTSEAAYMSFMASFSQKVGIIAVFLQLTASTIIKQLGWTRASQLTPMAMFFLAIPFFATVALSKIYPNSIPLTTALAIGTWQNVMNKITKYSLFDPLKEMAYIPLPPDAKTKGKAAIDVLGARLGRSIASGSQQLLVLLSGNILECAPYLAGLYFSTITLWLSAVKSLGKMFDGSSNNDDDGVVVRKRK